jgi:glycosyltransferase involved in cell wall biosynthesis
VGFDPDTPRWFRALDVLALPTYREGFPVVPLEAAAMRLPVVATAVPGCVDAVIDGETGTLVPSRDVPALAAALRAYLVDPALRRRHGEAARARVLREFARERVWAALRDDYLAQAARAGLAPLEPAGARG